MKRRDLLGILPAAILTPRPAAAQDAALPCNATTTLRDGVTASSSIPHDRTSGTPTARPVTNGYGRLSVTFQYAPAERLDSQSVPRRFLTFLLAREGDGNRPTIRLTSSTEICPTTTCLPDEDLQVRYKVDGQHLARLRSTASTERSRPVAKRGVVLDRVQENMLRGGRRLWLEVATRRGWERAEVSIRDLDDLIKDAERFHRNRLRAASEGRVCETPEADVAPVCYMSTVVLHDYGRSFEGFESRNLRSMRATFDAYPEQRAAYIRDSAEIGRLKEAVDVQVALAFFYLFFIWPAAGLAALRLYWPAGLWFFSGFLILRLYVRATRRVISILRRALGIRTSGGLD